MPKKLTARQIQRAEIKAARQKLREEKPRYHFWHARYLELLKEKRRLTRELRKQFKDTTAALREAEAIYKEAGEIMKKACDKRTHTGPTKAALEYARGFRDGQEATRRELAEQQGPAAVSRPSFRAPAPALKTTPKEVDRSYLFDESTDTQAQLKQLKERIR